MEARYTYTLATRDEEQLRDEIAARQLPGFACICGSGDAVQVVFADPLTAEQVATLTAAVALHVPDPLAQAKRDRAAAITALMTSTDPFAVATRAFLRDLYTRLNDSRELQGLPRDQEPEIVARVVGGIEQGLGDISQPQT